jgi:hypothetical protein
MKEFGKMLRTILFNKKEAVKLSKQTDAFKTVLAIIIASVILSIPTTTETTVKILSTLIQTLALFTTLILANSAVVKVLGGKNQFRRIVYSTSMTACLSLLFISLPAGVITLFLIPYLFHTQVFSAVIFSVIPFYNFIIFGWISEQASGNPDKNKKTATALASLTLIMLFYIILSGV